MIGKTLKTVDKATLMIGLIFIQYIENVLLFISF